MKVCIIGNSHIGSLKRAWDNLKDDYKNIDIIFFGSTGDSLSELEISDFKLVSKSEEINKNLILTSGTDGEISPLDYDHLLIYGLGLQNFVIGKEPFYSKDVIEAAFNDCIKESLLYKIFILIREISDQHIYVGHSPLSAADQIKSEGPSEEYLNAVKKLNHNFFNLHNSELLFQPFQTIVNGAKTHKDYSKNSLRLFPNKQGDLVKHPGDDKIHMNEDFGTIWLKAFLDKIYSEVSRC